MNRYPKKKFSTLILRSSVHPVALLIALSAPALAQIPDEGDAASFTNDLRFISAIAALPVEVMEAATSRLALATHLLGASADGIQSMQRFEYTIQPSEDFALRAALERWPGNEPVIGSSLCVNTYRRTDSKYDYSVGLTWHQIKEAGTFTQRDLAFQLAGIRAFDRIIVQAGGGPVLRHSYTEKTPYHLKDGVEWTGFAHLSYGIAKDLVMICSIPVTLDGFGIKFGLAWDLHHGIEQGTKDEPERK